MLANQPRFLPHAVPPEQFSLLTNKMHMVYFSYAISRTHVVSYVSKGAVVNIVMLITKSFSEKEKFLQNYLSITIQRFHFTKSGGFTLKFFFFCTDNSGQQVSPYSAFREMQNAKLASQFYCYVKRTLYTGNKIAKGVQIYF